MKEISKITVGELLSFACEWYVYTCCLIPPVMLIGWGVGEMAMRLAK